MGIRRDLLNPLQLEVLAWVGDGRTDGVYRDWSHRVTARALHHRGLIVVSGHGPGWTASLTDAGVFYLEHGSYPSPDSSGALVGEVEQAPKKPRAAHTSPPARQRMAQQPGKREPQVPKTGAVDLFLSSLNDAPGNRLLVPDQEGVRYRQLLGVAKRFGRIPEGMQIVFDHCREGADWMLQITLEPLPAWQTAVLDPLAVTKRLQDPSDVVVELVDSDTFRVAGEARTRALRLLDALVVHGRERGMKVKGLRAQSIRRDDYRVDVPRRDEIQFTVGGDHFRLWFTQATLQRPHEPTQREIARARRGYLFPDFDEVPDENLGISLEGSGGVFWASQWKDTDSHKLEDDLAQVLEEMRLRHENLVGEREKERERQQQRERDWVAAHEDAVVKYREQFLVDAMHSQARKWAKAANLRRYAEAIRVEAERINEPDQARAILWAEQIEARADEADPLPAAAYPPTIPEPSTADLKPFMGSWSPYGP